MQITASVNFWAVLVSAIVSMVIGSLWYGPFFGKAFIRAKGMDKKSPEEQAAMKKGMMWSYVGQFIASLVMFYIFAWLMSALGMMSVMGGIQTAFWVWLGFIVPLKFGEELWGGKMTLFWLGVSHMLLTLLAAGAIIGAMAVSGY